MSNHRKLMQLSDLINYGYIQPSSWTPYVTDARGIEHHGRMAEMSECRPSRHLIWLQSGKWVSVSEFVSGVRETSIMDGYHHLMMRTKRPSGEQFNITLDRLRQAVAEAEDWCTCERDEARWPSIQSPSPPRQYQSKAGARVGTSVGTRRKRPLKEKDIEMRINKRRRLQADDNSDDGEPNDSGSVEGDSNDSDAENSAVELGIPQPGNDESEEDVHATKQNDPNNTVSDAVSADTYKTESDSGADSDVQADRTTSVENGCDADGEEKDASIQCWPPRDEHHSVDPAKISMSTRFDVDMRRRERDTRPKRRGGDPTFVGPSAYSQEMRRRCAAARGQSDATVHLSTEPKRFEDLSVALYDYRVVGVIACKLPWVFMPSKGRAGSAHINLQAFGLESYRTICVVVERGDYEAYRVHVGQQHVLAVMDECSRGIGYARLIIQCLASRLAFEQGWDMYWSIDDNICAFHTVTSTASHHHQLLVVDMCTVMQEAEKVMNFADDAKTLPRQHPIAMVGFESERGQRPTTHLYAFNRFVAACVLINIRATDQVTYQPSNRTKKEDVGFFNRLMWLNQNGHSCCTLKLRQYRWRVMLSKVGGIIQAKRERDSARAARDRPSPSRQNLPSSSSIITSSSSPSTSTSTRLRSSSPMEVLRKFHRHLHPQVAVLPVESGPLSQRTPWQLEQTMDVITKYERRHSESQDHSRRPASTLVAPPLCELLLEHHNRIDWSQILSALLPNTKDAVDLVAAHKKWRKYWDEWTKRSEISGHPERASVDKLLSQVHFRLINSQDHILHLREGTHSWDEVKHAVEHQKAGRSSSDTDDMPVTPKRSGGRLGRKYRTKLGS